MANRENIEKNEMTLESKKSFLKDSFANENIVLSESQIEDFLLYYERLIKVNEVMNLTAITEFKEVVVKHFLDSCEVVNFIDMSLVDSLIDIGTGAGFPGIPLKILFPHLKIVLLDSLNKRINFLNEVIDELNMKQIQAVHGRSEELGRKTEYREQFDLALSRAVANLQTLSEYCLPFVKVEGRFISYKSGDIENELEKSENAIEILGGKLEKVEKFGMNDNNIQRSFVIIDKIKNTNKKYPRKPGDPASKPLN